MRKIDNLNQTKVFTEKFMSLNKFILDELIKIKEEVSNDQAPLILIFARRRLTAKYLSLLIKKSLDLTQINNDVFNK